MSPQAHFAPLSCMKTSKVQNICRGKGKLTGLKTALKSQRENTGLDVAVGRNHPVTIKTRSHPFTNSLIRMTFLFNHHSQF